MPADLEIEEICTDPVLHAEAKAVAPMLLRVIEPCGENAVRLALQPLVLVYGVGEAARSSAFWKVYLKALSGLPLEALMLAVDDYNASPSAEFFPKPGPLKHLAELRAIRLRRAAHRAKRAADSLRKTVVVRPPLEERRALVEEAIRAINAGWVG